MTVFLFFPPSFLSVRLWLPHSRLAASLYELPTALPDLGGTALVLLDYFQEILAGSSSTSVGLDELVKAQSDVMEVN